MNWPFRARKRADADESRLELDSARGRALVEGSPDIVVMLDEQRNVAAASRRALESLPGIELGRPLPAVGTSGPAETPAYAELRAGFTAAVSHELRTPLARLLALVDSASLPGADPAELLDRAREEIVHMGELIDDVLFLSELETEREVVSLGPTPVLPLLRDVAAELAASAERAAVTVRVHAPEDVAVPLRPRMLRVVAENLIANAVRYAGPGATFTLSATPQDGAVVLDATDDGVGVDESDLARLFERFYRADPSRSAPGTGLGLAIVKHVVTAAGGSVEAHGGRGKGLRVRCVFPLG